MNRTVVAHTLVAAAALTAMGLVAATPASAHTNSMFTLVINSDDAGGGFSTYGKTDGVVAPLPSASFVTALDIVTGIEVAGEKGTAVGYTSDPLVFTWNHSTGTFTPQVVIFVNNPLQHVAITTGLDTLNDGRTVTLADVVINEGTVEEPDNVDHWIVGSINAGTGEFTPLLDFTEAVMNVDGSPLYEIMSIATEPQSGFSYVFVRDGAGVPHFIEMDVVGGTFGDPIPFEGDGFEDGAVQGADFDADGTLYFNYFDDVEEALPLELSKLSAGAQWMTAPREVISKAPSNFDTYLIDAYALTIEHTALAATGSELPIAAFALLGTVAVLAGGVTVMVARRRSERGTI